MKGFCPLGSGSRGNCIYFGTRQTKILIDAGLSGRAIGKRLEEIDVDLSEIDAILISHDHGDHIQGLKVLAYRLGIPVFANAETAKGIVESFSDCPKFKIFSTGETFEFGDLEIHPFTIPHDTMDPVAFTIRTGGLKIGFCTDLGFATTLVQKRLQECDYLYLEANYDPELLEQSKRPLYYKQRVKSRFGHLGNQQTAELLETLWNPKLKRIYLAHLSSECNSQERAVEAVQSRLKAGPDIQVAFQERISLATTF